MKHLNKAYIIGTCDTKYPDLTFVRDILKKSGVSTVLVDVSSMERLPTEVAIKNQLIAFKQIKK